MSVMTENTLAGSGVVASARISLNANQRLRITALWAGINRYILSPQRIFLWEPVAGGDSRQPV